MSTCLGIQLEKIFHTRFFLVVVVVVVVVVFVVVFDRLRNAGPAARSLDAGLTDLEPLPAVVQPRSLQKPEGLDWNASSMTRTTRESKEKRKKKEENE